MSPTPALTARRSVLEFATEVAGELKLRGVAAATAEYDPDSNDPDEPAEARVRIDVGNPMAPLRIWRQIVHDFAGVVLVVRSGRVVTADLQEVHTILRTVGIRPLAVVLTRHQRARWKPARVPMAAGPAVTPRSGGRVTTSDQLGTPARASAAGRSAAPPARSMTTATAVRARPLLGTDDGTGKPAR